MNENEWMNEWMNENECDKAWKVIGIKKYVRISRFVHFKRLRYRPTNQPTNGHDLLKKCEDALKNDTKELRYFVIGGSILGPLYRGATVRLTESYLYRQSPWMGEKGRFLRDVHFLSRLLQYLITEETAEWNNCFINGLHNLFYQRTRLYIQITFRSHQQWRFLPR